MVHIGQSPHKTKVSEPISKAVRRMEGQDSASDLKNWEKSISSLLLLSIPKIS